VGGGILAEGRNRKERISDLSVNRVLQYGGAATRAGSDKRGTRAGHRLRGSNPEMHRRAFTLLGDVKTFSPIGILILASEELSKDGIISGECQGRTAVRWPRGL
jgi:hypothetical protein